jgi:hypothetical protein
MERECDKKCGKAAPFGTVGKKSEPQRKIGS